MSGGAVTETRKLMIGRESEVVAALGVTLPTRGWHMECPLQQYHPRGDKNPSFRIDMAKGRYFCSTHQGDLLDLVREMGRGHDPLSAAQWVRDVLGLEPLGQRKPETPAQRTARERQQREALAKAEELRKQREVEHAEEVKAQRVKAFRMWMRRKPAAGTIVETYLRSRGITCPLPGTIGFLPPAKPEHHPAMISAFGIPDEPEPGLLQLPPARLRGVHLTLLHPDGRGKAEVENAKLTVGLDHNMPIVLAAPNDGLAVVIAEGIEDALEAHQRTGLGAWAAGTANRMPGLAGHVPGCIEVVTVLVDADAAGRRSSQQLEVSLRSRGIGTRCIEAPQERAHAA